MMKKWIVVLLHLGYWIMYTFIFWALCESMFGGQQISPKRLMHIMFFSPMSAGAYWPGLMCFYVFYFVLFGRFLQKRRIVVFVLVAIGTALASGFLTLLFMYPFFSKVAPFNGHTEAFFPIVLFLAFIGAVHGTIGLIIKGFITWYDEIKVKVELNQKNYEMELELMKAQINPHFLFNTINNIDVLILKDANKASEYLNKLSDIMRFMLYETKAVRIPLSKELAYIEKYVELQRIRTSNPNYIQFSVNGEAGSLQITPMLLIPYIENAFKHAEDKKIDNAIKISLQIGKDELHFDCENAYPSNKGVKPEHGGLGNDLIKRRLALLYPGKHSMQVIDANGIYKVQLKLRFD